MAPTKPLPDATRFAGLAVWMRSLRPFGSVIAAAATGILLSIGAWFLVAGAEDRAAQQQFSRIATDHVQGLQTGLDKYLHTLRSLQALFNASDDGVSRTEFDHFTRGLPDGDKAILTYGWIPRIDRGERAAFERAAIRDGVPGFRIQAIRPGHGLVTAPEQDVYFPVYYLNGSLQASIYGIDLHDGGARQATLEHARDHDEMAASGTLELKGGDGDRRGFMVALPVYRAGRPHDTVATRRENLIGFVQGVFQFHVISDSLMTGIKVPLRFFAFDPASRPGAAPVLVHSDRASGAAIPAGMPHWTGRIRTGDKSWPVVVTPTSFRSTFSRHAKAWIVLLAGLLITGLVSAHLHLSIREARRLARARDVATRLAHTDSITGLANRRSFSEHLDEAFAAVKQGAPPFAVHLIDLDEFKDINDTRGHSTGDALLRAIAARLREIVAPEDCIARLGGDEFAILQMTAPHSADAGRLAQKIIDAMAEPYPIDDTDLRVAASIGIALHGGQSAGAKAILMQADLALYRAKDDGRGCFRFHRGELDQQVHLRVNLAEELRQGIARGELELHYQTQVNLQTGQVIGLEALVRWNHPTRGQIPPAVFIPVAERMGTIIPLGQWVLSRACRQVRQWEDQRLKVPPVAVNVSGAQMRHPRDFERAVAEAFLLNGIRHHAIELELTESVLMDVTERQSASISRLQDLGAKIAIDDFGTGYSSLRYLANYPVNRLKIAQELVCQITADPRCAVVVRSAIGLARDLGIACIAEGVEHPEQAQFLIDLGCEEAQGYYYSKPMPADDIALLLADPDGSAPAFKPVRMLHN